jgi:hypothetical protein
MILDELAGYIAAQGLGTLGTSLFLGRLPPTPDSVIALRESGGPPPINTFDASYERPSLQVLVRGSAYTSARLQAERLYQALTTVANTAISGVWYIHVTPDGPPTLLEHDESGRPILVFNLEVEKEFE